MASKRDCFLGYGNTYGGEHKNQRHRGQHEPAGCGKIVPGGDDSPEDRILIKLHELVIGYWVLGIGYSVLMNAIGNIAG